MRTPTRRTRVVVGYAAIAFMVPYIALKVLWVSGVPVGVTDESFLDDGGLLVANVLTGGMDALAVVVALALTYDWGQRIPAWLVLLPMWVATGLLAPIAIGAPLAALAELAGPDRAADGGLPLSGWVYPMVYGGFVAQGIALAIAFVLYTRARWPFLSRADTARTDPNAGLQRLLGNAFAPLAALVGGLTVAGAVGADSPSGVVVGMVHALMCFAAAAGFWRLTRTAGGPLWRPLALTWVGAGAMFGWSLFLLLNRLAQSVIDPGGDLLDGVVNVLKLMVGITIGLAAAFRLTGTRA